MQKLKTRTGTYLSLSLLGRDRLRAYFFKSRELIQQIEGGGIE